jgi:hypothetical protein
MVVGSEGYDIDGPVEYPKCLQAVSVAKRG